MGVFSDDFATVDFREELCYHSRPKKQIQRWRFAFLERKFQKTSLLGKVSIKIGYNKHTPRLQIDFSEVVYRDYFICFGQRYQLIVKADNTTCAAFHVWDIVELLESRYVLFVRIGVLFYLNGI